MSVIQEQVAEAIATMAGQRFNAESETTVRVGPDGVVHLWSDTSDIAKVLKRLEPDDLLGLWRTGGARPAYMLEVKPGRYRGVAMMLRHPRASRGSGPKRGQFGHSTNTNREERT